MSPVAVTKVSDMVPVSSKEFLEIHAITECGFSLKRLRDRVDTVTTCFDLVDINYSFFSFPINYGVGVTSLCGDNSTEYRYGVFMLEKLFIYGKLREFVFLFVFIIFLLLFRYSSINSYMVSTW